MEIDGLGARCSLPSCRTLDYLPFRCDACKQQFCQHHKLPIDHNCSVARPKIVPKCPLCSAPVPVPPNSTPDQAVSRHIEAGCPKRHRSNPVCAHPSCSVRDPVATKCNACGRVFCLAHRLEEDHDCPVAAAKKQQQRPPMSLSGAASAHASRLLSIPIGFRRAQQKPQQPQKSSSSTATAKPSSPPPKRNQKVPAARPSASPTKSSAPTAAAKTAYRLDFFNKPTAPLGDTKIDVENRAPFAVIFPPSSNIQPRYMYFSRKYSAGKIIDSIGKVVPALQAPPPGARYSLYAVKHDLSSVNLLPHITPISELKHLLGANDYLVLDTSTTGLDPSLMSSFKSLNLGRSSPFATSKRGGKCIVA